MTTAPATQPLEGWWKKDPCPTWCDDHHERGLVRLLDDCHHSSPFVKVPMALLSDQEDTAELHVALWQRVNDLGPHAVLYSEWLKDEIRLTPTECMLLIERLQELLAMMKPGASEGDDLSAIST